MPPLKLEVFRIEELTPSTVVPTEDAAAEEIRLAAYEQGYSAGWEDCSAAAQSDERRMTAELARNLQAMSFTYHEARDHVLHAVGPLMHEIATKLLPAAAREALAPLVLEALLPQAEAATEAPIVVIVNPAMANRVATILETAGRLPLTIREEPSLGEGQVHLIFGEVETRIDLDRAQAEIVAALRNFFEPSERHRKHG